MEKEKKFLKDTLQKDIYTKNEVLKLLRDYGKKREDQSREKTINVIESFVSDIREKVPSDYYFRINPDIVDPDEKNTFRGYLYEKLHENLFFEGEVRKRDFERIFSGVEAKKGEPINKIKWKNDRQGIYLLYYLYEKNVIDNEGYSRVCLRTGNKINHIVPLTNLESFRALKLSGLKNFSTLNS